MLKMALERDFVTEVFEDIDPDSISLFIASTHNLDANFNELFDYIQSLKNDNFLILFETGNFQHRKNFRGKIIKNTTKRILHSKLFLVEYHVKNKVRYKILLTSANLTNPGYKNNLEVMWSKSDLSLNHPLVISAVTYCRMILKDLRLQDLNLDSRLNQICRNNESKNILLLNGKKSIEKYIADATDLIIASPYFCGKTKNENFVFLSKYLEGKHRVSIITEFNSGNIQLDPDYFKSKSNYNVFVLEDRRIHAKMYLLKIGNSWKLIIGSSNFSNAGLNSNFEANILIEHITESQKNMIFNEKRFCNEKISQIHTWNFDAKQRTEREPIDELSDFIYNHLDWSDPPICTKDDKKRINFDASKLFPNKFKLDKIKISCESIKESFILNKAHIKDYFEFKVNELQDIEEMKFKVGFKKRSLLIIISLQDFEYENPDYALLALLDCKQQVNSHIFHKHKISEEENICEIESITSGIDYVIKIGNYISKLNRNLETVQFSNSAKKQLTKLLEFVNKDENGRIGSFKGVIIDKINQILNKIEAS